MKKQLFFLVMKLLLAALGIGLLYEHQYIWAVLILFFYLDRTFFRRDAAIENLKRIAWDSRTNLYLRIGVDVEEVLKHPSLEKVYADLRKNGKLPQESIEAWRKSLFENYGKIEPKGFHLFYRIKNNMLFKDGVVDRSEERPCRERV